MGPKSDALMRNAYAYVQPSAIEGLSPVILEAAYVGAPIICSDIPQNRYGIAEYGTDFRSGDVADLTAKLQWSLDVPEELAERAAAGSHHVASHFSWNKVVDDHIATFTARDRSDERNPGQPVQPNISLTASTRSIARHSSAWHRNGFGPDHFGTE